MQVKIISPVTKKKNLPLYGWLGLIFISVFWILNWSLDGLRTHWGFFPLWLGYILTVDSIVFIRRGNSLISRSLKNFITLFLISAPVWWLFELFNSIMNNWLYSGKEYFSDFEYFLLASLSFSTVIPAVFETTELVNTFNFIRKIKNGLVINENHKTLVLFFSSGFILLILILAFPHIFYPFIWLSLYLIIEPVNAKTGRSTLFNFTKNGNWSPVISLWIGCLICGFFWEMWNYYSYPKWIYNLPGVDFLHIFEMPLPGYIGYIPFSMELFAIYNFFAGFKSLIGLKNYFQII